MCIRDDAGEYDVAIGEVVGLYMTLQWVSNLQFDNIVDFVCIRFTTVVDSFHTGVDDQSEFGCIINAYKQLFYDRFQNSHVEFNTRQTNGVAHELGKTDPSEFNPCIYNDVLSCICHILSIEMN